MKQIPGTELLIKALRAEGVDTVFGYPGGMVTDIFEELYNQDDIRVILPRHEQALVHEADGYARSTGKIGVCLVTSGPGATNTVTGIATAYYDSVPLLVLTGQVPCNLIGNDAFQEADIIGITRGICKYGVILKKREDLGRVLKEAFYIAQTGKPGPVIIDLPKDVMAQLGDSIYPDTVNIRGYKPSTGVHIGQLKRGIDLLKHAKRPLFLIGGGVTIAHAHDQLTDLVNQTHIPVVTTIMGKGAIDTDHPYYIGNIGMHGTYAGNMAISSCDVLFSIGTRFSDRVTGKISDFAKHAKIVHIDIDSSSISRNIVVDVPIVADAKEAIVAMQRYVKEYDTAQWMEEIHAWDREHPLHMKKGRGITPEAIIDAVSEHKENAIVVTDVGQHQMWTTQYLKMDASTRLLTSGGMGTMGYGLPGAIGAQLARPDKRVFCITGDGGFQMNIQEMATAVAQELPIIICLFNNHYLGMVRQFQALFYRRHYSSVCTRRRKNCPVRCGGPSSICPDYTPDFVKLAESYGALGLRVQEESQIQSAIEQALANTQGPTIIEFVIACDELVFPMVPGGNALNDMILDY